jgi:hypothetical protein
MGDPSQAPLSSVCVCTQQSIMAPRYRARDVTKHIFSPLVILIVLGSWCPPLPSVVSQEVYSFNYLVILIFFASISPPRKLRTCFHNRRDIFKRLFKRILSASWCPPLRTWSHRRHVETSRHPFMICLLLLTYYSSCFWFQKADTFKPLGFLIVSSWCHHTDSWQT